MRRRLRGEPGTALILLPACLLVVLVLAAIAVDLSLVHLRQRQAFDLAAGAANDAVTAGVDPGELRSGRYHVDPYAAEAVVRQTVARSELATRLDGPPVVSTAGDSVEVRLTVRVDRLFTGMMPGTTEATVVTATASATAAEG